jgi:Flp pilus assembly protein TadD
MAKAKKEMTVAQLEHEIIELHNEKKHSAIITLLTNDLLTKHQLATLYNYRGRAYSILEKYDEAFIDYNSAIDLDEDSVYYYNRALIYDARNEDQKAIGDYTKCIELDPDDADAYNNRGVIWGSLGKYDDAIKDYTYIIENIDKEYSSAYNNRGYAYERIGEYENALIDYEAAINLHPNYVTAENNLNKLIDNRGSSLQLFIESLKNTSIPPIQKSTLFKIFSATKKDAIDKIRELAGKNINKLIGKQVVHYTKLSVADSIASGKSKKLRYYNAIYMNDPEEGQVILDYLDKDVRTAFENANKQEEGNVYIGSFLPAQQHEDELVMWRTYGKDENQVEGAGCSISIKKDFFDDYADDNYINPKFVSKDPFSSSFRQNLFRVLYYNKNHEQNGSRLFDCRESKKIQEYVDILNKQLLELVKLKDNKEEYTDKDKAIDKIIYHLISEIRFFFKSSDYSFENEVRVLQYADKSSDLLKIDERNTLPKKVYIESNKEIQPSIERITLGPKVPNPKQWLYLDVAMRQNNPTLPKPVEFIISERKYQ